jgi:hypothetical protein
MHHDLFDINAGKTRSCGQYLLDNFEYIIGYFRCSNALNLTFQLQPQLVAQLRDLNARVECDVQQWQTTCDRLVHCLLAACDRHIRLALALSGGGYTLPWTGAEMINIEPDRGQCCNSLSLIT